MRNMNGRKSPQPSPPSSPTRHEMGSERRGGMELDQRPLPSLDAALGVDVGYSGSTPPIAIDGGMVDEDGAGGADLDDMSDGERRMFEVFDEIEPIAWKDEVRVRRTFTSPRPETMKSSYRTLSSRTPRRGQMR